MGKQALKDLVIIICQVYYFLSSLLGVARLCFSGLLGDLLWIRSIWIQILPHTKALSGDLDGAIPGPPLVGRA
jgi:hypothetical protein